MSVLVNKNSKIIVQGFMGFTDPMERRDIIRPMNKASTDNLLLAGKEPSQLV